MKKLNLAAIPVETGCNYPPPFDAPCLGSTWRRLGRFAGLTQFGVNLSRLPPGVWSSQRHWHTHEDEFVFVVEGELTLVTNAGEEILRAGECAAFKAGDPDGHHLINRSGKDAVVLEVGNSDPARDRCDYPDIDMVAEPGVEPYLHRDGAPYPVNRSQTTIRPT
ncbi:MAG TPA: cupin domain-containing protein [Caulobacteraceae bacterium]|nr:cupin domain-containing protein [Caulobacteraceae bacterium]